MAQLHGGTVEAESEGARRGTTFIVSLPLCKESAKALEENEVDVLKSFKVNGNEDKRLKGLRVSFVEDAADSREMVSSLPLCKESAKALEENEVDVLKSFKVNGNEDKRLRGLRVLFVEDAADSREMVSFVLNVSGAVVTEAGAAAEAFELFQTENFDVLISDIGLPDEDGYSLMKRIRRHTSGQNAGCRLSR